MPSGNLLGPCFSSLDLASPTLYKLGQRDFTDEGLEKIFVELKDHMLGRKKKFEIKYFAAKIAKLDNALATRIEELYLREVDPIVEEDEDKQREELVSTLRRVKVETAKREMKILGDKIREAEVKGDTAEVKRLSSEFKNVSERLL